MVWFGYFYLFIIRILSRCFISKNTWISLLVSKLEKYVLHNENDVRFPTKKRKLKLRHSVQRYLGQSEVSIVWVSLITRTCNVWRNQLSVILLGIGHHFKLCRYINCQGKRTATQTSVHWPRACRIILRSSR